VVKLTKDERIDRDLNEAESFIMQGRIPEAILKFKAIIEAVRPKKRKIGVVKSEKRRVRWEKKST